MLVETVPLVQASSAPISKSASVHNNEALSKKPSKVRIGYLPTMPSFKHFQQSRTRLSLLPRCSVNSCLEGQSHAQPHLQPVTLPQGDRPRNMVFTCHSLCSISRKQISCTPSACAAMVILPSLLHEISSALAHSATRIRAHRFKLCFASLNALNHI